VARDGIIYVLLPVIALVIALALGYWYIALAFALVAAFMAFFFRDPNRRIPTDADIVVSPADGRVTRIEKLAAEDSESGTLVSIFLSVFDVHINRAPIKGEITDVTYTKGRFVIATRSDASIVNEQNALTIQNERMTVVCKQIAGILARRIVCWKRAGDRVALGDRFGLIKFSSRTDLILPPSVEINVKVGDRVKGGLTVIGRMRA
jgi:phosphatidylserine decarboxylase